MDIEILEKKKEELKQQIESQILAELWQDELPSEWIKFIPVVSVILEVILITIILIKF